MEEQKRKQLALKIFNEFETLMNNLNGRWSCEKEYEDFNDYITIVKNELKKYPEVEFLKMNKRPFGFMFKIDSAEYQIISTSRAYSYKRLK